MAGREAGREKRGGAEGLFAYLAEERGGLEFGGLAVEDEMEAGSASRYDSA